MEQLVKQTLEPHFNFWIYVILMMIGLWAVIAKNNLIKKLIGLSIFQTAIILFYVSLGVKEDATIPIKKPIPIEYGEKAYGGEAEAKGDYATAEKAPGDKKTDGKKGDPRKKKKKAYEKIDPDKIANPLPHVLMLTAIVVGVATLGVALAITQMIFKEFGTVEEDEVLKVIKGGGQDE